MPLYLALIIILAAAALIIIIQLQQKLELKLNVPSLAVGALAVIVAMQIKELGIGFSVIGGRDPVMSLFFGLFAVGLCAQLIAFIYLRLAVYPSKVFKDPLFGLINSLWVSLGMILPHLFFLSESDNSLLPLLIIFGQLSLGFVLGYFMSMSKFTTEAQQNFMYQNTGLGASIIIQGLMEFFRWEQQFSNLMVLILGTGFISLIVLAHLLRLRTELSSEQNRNQLLEELYQDKE
jgi:hypothetical protein